MVSDCGRIGQETPLLSLPTPQRKGYFTFVEGLPICAIETREIVDLSDSMNSEYNAEIHDETPIETVTFCNVLHCLETVRTCLSDMQQDTKDAVFSSMHKVEKRTLSSQQSK
ncbi:hypothetical protein TNCV_4751301 [Trichonephila clavipes]|nr:hypothetical protein TNCV_4751301 [Trichonephila clavipes]